MCRYSLFKFWICWLIFSDRLPIFLHTVDDKRNRVETFSTQLLRPRLIHDFLLILMEHRFAHCGHVSTFRSRRGGWQGLINPVPSRYHILADLGSSGWTRSCFPVGIWPENSRQENKKVERGETRKIGSRKVQPGLPSANVASATRMQPWHTGISDYLSLTHYTPENCMRALNYFLFCFPCCFPRR